MGADGCFMNAWDARSLTGSGRLRCRLVDLGFRQRVWGEVPAAFESRTRNEAQSDIPSLHLPMPKIYFIKISLRCNLLVMLDIIVLFSHADLGLDRCHVVVVKCKIH
jgi:hypothetical protein